MRIARRHLLSGLAGAALISASKPALAQSVQTYTYDALGRLIKVVYADGSSVRYAYDATGNRRFIVQAVPGGSFTTTIPITGTGAVNLRTLAEDAGYDGTQNANVTFTLASGVTITGAAGGGIAIDSGTWPTSSYTITLALQISGTVRGGGGAGGEGDDVGSNGGDAIHCRLPMSVAVNAGGVVASGGGGGGGGATTGVGGKFGGGGGGGGAPNGPGGGGSEGWQTTGAPGQPGTTSGGGAGGSPGGGAGGTYAAAGTGGSGGSAGAAGFAIRKNGNTVNVTNNGTITGTVG